MATSTQMDVLGVMQRSLGSEWVGLGGFGSEVRSIIDEDDFSFDSQCFYTTSVMSPTVSPGSIPYLDLEASD